MGLQLNTGNFYGTPTTGGRWPGAHRGQSPSGADPRRAPYEITKAGAGDFAPWFVELNDSDIDMTPHEDALFSRVLFVDTVTPTAARRVVPRWCNGLWLRVKTLKRGTGDCVASTREEWVSMSGAFPAGASRLTRGLRHIAADLEFLEEFRSSYDGWIMDRRTQAGRNSSVLESNRLGGRSARASRRRS